MTILDLTLALVITSNMIISCQSASVNVLGRREGLMERALSLSSGRHRLMVKESSLDKNVLNRVKRPNELLRKWNIHPMQIQLDIVIDKYNKENSIMEKLYEGVKGCGIDGCQNFRNFIPETKHQPDSNIFNNRKRHLGKKVYQLLGNFYEGLQKIEKSFWMMLRYENSTGFFNEFRVSLLKELKRDVKMLNTEVETALKIKQYQVTPIAEEVMYYVFPFPLNQTDLTIQEWYVIQGSKKYLTEWRKILIDLETQSMNINNTANRERSRKLKKKSKWPRLHRKRGHGKTRKS